MATNSSNEIRRPFFPAASEPTFDHKTQHLMSIYEQPDNGAELATVLSKTIHYMSFIIQKWNLVPDEDRYWLGHLVWTPVHNGWLADLYLGNSLGIRSIAMKIGYAQGTHPEGQGSS